MERLGHEDVQLTFQKKQELENLMKKQLQEKDHNKKREIMVYLVNNYTVPEFNYACRWAFQQYLETKRREREWNTD